MQPLERVLAKDVLRIIFPCIKELVDIHEKFLAKLRETVAVDSKLKLSVVFLEFREPFLIYGDYCSSMTNATDMLREVGKKSSNVEQIVKVSKLLSIMHLIHNIMYREASLFQSTFHSA